MRAPDDDDDTSERLPDVEGGGAQGPPTAGTPEEDSLTRSKRSTMQLIKRVWRAEPVPRPSIDPDLGNLPWPERCAEAIRYAFLTGERWISGRGGLREWIRINLWVGVGLLAIALLVVPPITMLLEGVSIWAGLVHDTVSAITATIMVLPPVVIAIAALWISFRVLRRNWHARQRRRRFEEPDDR